MIKKSIFVSFAHVFIMVLERTLGQTPSIKMTNSLCINADTSSLVPLNCE